MHVGPVPMDGVELLHDLDLGDAVIYKPVLVETLVPWSPSTFVVQYFLLLSMQVFTRQIDASTSLRFGIQNKH